MKFNQLYVMNYTIQKQELKHIPNDIPECLQHLVQKLNEYGLNLSHKIQTCIKINLEMLFEYKVIGSYSIIPNTFKRKVLLNVDNKNYILIYTGNSYTIIHIDDRIQLNMIISIVIYDDLLIVTNTMRSSDNRFGIRAKHKWKSQYSLVHYHRISNDKKSYRYTNFKTIKRNGFEMSYIDNILYLITCSTMCYRKKHFMVDESIHVIGSSYHYMISSKKINISSKIYYKLLSVSYRNYVISKELKQFNTEHIKRAISIVKASITNLPYHLQQLIVELI